MSQSVETLPDQAGCDSAARAPRTGAATLFEAHCRRLSSTIPLEV